MYKEYTIMVHKDAKLLVVEQYDEYGSLVTRSNVSVPDLEAAQQSGQRDVCQKCGSKELIEYPEDPRYLVCADCGTRR